MITISWIKKNGNLDPSICVDEGLRSDLPSQTILHRDRERERERKRERESTWGLGAGWVDEGGRCSQIRVFF